MALSLCDKANLRTIIDIGCRTGEKCCLLGRDRRLLGIDFPTFRSPFVAHNPKAEFLAFDLEKGLPSEAIDQASEALVVCGDVFERISDLTPLLDALGRIAQKAPFLMLSTPSRDRGGNLNYGSTSDPHRAHEWTLDEFCSLLDRSRIPPFLSGYVTNTSANDTSTSNLVISGTQAGAGSAISRPSITAIIHCFNEADIISETIRHLIEQGIKVVAIDNWSQDGTYETLIQMRNRSDLIEVLRFPETPRLEYLWHEQLKETERLAQCLDSDWFLHHDADERREPPWPDKSLAEGIAIVDQCGYNAVDFTVLDFRYCRDMTIRNAGNWTDRLTHFEFGRQPWHFLQVKAWKRQKEGVRLASSGGHNVEFPERRVYPLKFVSRHYPLRNAAQARRKILVDRLPRTERERTERRWHIQYSDIDEKSDFAGWLSSTLIPWHPVKSRMEYMTKLLFGIGICPEQSSRLERETHEAVSPQPLVPETRHHATAASEKLAAKCHKPALAYSDRRLDSWVKFAYHYLLVYRSGLFNAAYYLETNPDVAKAGIPALWHFMRHGSKEGRNPSSKFDTSFYLRTNPDVAAVGINPLAHYIRFGKREGRKALPDSGEQSYSSPKAISRESATER
jgi:glycosyltransferase involved in cell wall biosynthesis